MDILKDNLLVLASAGSGKTYCLSDRVIGLMAGGVEPESIVALTFTRKAAGEFADAILKKLAETAVDAAKAAELEGKFGRGGVDFPELLEKVVRKLPRLTLGTMDGFFAKVVKGFQYELGVTGGKFDLLEGEVAEGVKDDLLEGLLDGTFGNALPDEEEFVNAFRRAMAGKEGTRVLEELRDFIQAWHGHFLSQADLEWGPAGLAGVAIEDWEKQKGGLIAQARRDWDSVVTTDKRQEKAFSSMLDALERHTVGSGSLDKATSLLKSVMEAAAGGGGALEVSFYKPFTITGLGAQALRDLVGLAAHCEFAAALARTRGVHGVIAAYDGLVESELRRNGKLGFDDVKRLMGAWMKAEDARLRREAVDFRLDASYSHWLLDEFQDTSRDEWNALFPLIDEGMSDAESTVFVVGDKKQAIYAWRGGEVGLFDELTRHYGSGLEVATMAESWRSCPEVLDPVNRVFGDAETMSRLFGAVAASRWEWEEHVSAEPLRDPAKAGYSRVEVIGKDEEKTERVIALLRELGVGEKRISCGVLMNTNKHVRELADALREAGFQVVEEGAREPGKDHPVGVLVWQLLRWLADPADSFARQTVMMSPLRPILEERFGNAWQAAWEKLGGLVSERGFAGMAGEMLSALHGQLGDFGRRRAEDLLEALRELDRQGVVTAREAADWIGRMKISQSPGVAAVQVMTFHKSKGLGFDIVILPDIPKDKIPDFGHYRTVTGDTWLSAAPAQWARTMIPELREPEEKWVIRQTYEAFCKLYVAMTRSKRGLYVFLDTPAAKADDEKASLPNWLMASLDLAGENTVFETGNPAWTDGIEALEKPHAPASGQLGKAVAKRSRTTPSGQKKAAAESKGGSAEGRRFGTETHAEFEKVGWIDEGEPVFSDGPAGNCVREALRISGIRSLFTKGGRHVSLHREQRIEAVIDGKWMSGVIDRLHIHRDASGEAERIEILDFKTDRVGDAEELREKYSGQMEAYRKAMGLIHPQAEIECLLVSTSLGEVV